MDNDPSKGSEGGRGNDGRGEEGGEERGEGGLVAHHSAFDANTKAGLGAFGVAADRTKVVKREGESE